MNLDILRSTAKLAENLGQKPENIFILSNGDQLSVNKERAIKFENVVSADDILVDGLGVGDVGNIVLKDRKATFRVRTYYRSCICRYKGRNFSFWTRDSI